MEILAWKQATGGLIKKYRTALLVVLAGIVLVCLPQQESKPAPVPTTPQVQKADLEQQLEEILSKIAGAGKVEVLLSQAAGEQTLYQQDQDGPGQQTSTVVLHGEARQEVGLVRQVNPPRYQGAIVACQGANNPQLRLELVEAVCRTTGLGADRVSILELK